MEGPSLVIACEEFEPLLKQRVQRVSGSAKLPFSKIKGQRLKFVRSWGKHFLLGFETLALRVHFLMFGSYRLNSERPDRDPKLSLEFSNGYVNFYSCAIKEINIDVDAIYDWSVDLMSEDWNAKGALARVRARPDEMVCDVLMDQDIFAGLGNIIKNEVLFRLRLNPEAKVSDLPSAQQSALVKDAHDYSHLFYEWKKQNTLKRNWQIFRKKSCPRCDTEVEKRKTGALDRWSHFCPSCQSLHPRAARSKKHSAQLRRDSTHAR